MPRDEVGEQIVELTGEVASAQVIEELYNRSGGNPFFIEQLLAARELTPADRALPARLECSVAVHMRARWLPRWQLQVDRLMTHCCVKSAISTPRQRAMGCGSLLTTGCSRTHPETSNRVGGMRSWGRR